MYYEYFNCCVCFCNMYCTYIFCVLFVYLLLLFCSCFVALCYFVFCSNFVALCYIYCFVCTSVVLLPGENPIAVRSSSCKIFCNEIFPAGIKSQ